MEKGKLLGRGVTAEVYEWGEDKILKLYLDKYSSDEMVNHESKIGHIVYESGIISPAVYDNVEIDGRKGIIFQRIHGESVIDNLIAEPWKLYYYIKKLAVLQYDIHKFSSDRLSTQKERFTYTIKLSSPLLGYKSKRILDYVDSLPDGNSICHGDLHFNNVIVSDNKLVPIDWNGAYNGNPLGDVARTCMLISSPFVPDGVPDGVPDIEAMLFFYPKMIAYWTYAKEYLKLSGARYKDIDAWILPVAAAKLKDNIPGERKWLMDIIDTRLARL